MPSAPIHFALTALIVALNVGGQTLMKLGSGHGYINGFIVSALSMYAVSAFLYIKMLTFTNLSTAFPLVIGCTVLLTFLSGVYYLNEQTSWIHWVGFTFILAGITIFALEKI